MVSDSHSRKAEEPWQLFKTIFGTSITAFTIYSHLDTIINLSESMQWMAEQWRELIALPWIWFWALFGIDIPKTMAGFLTVIFGTALVVQSAWSETLIDMKAAFRINAILLASGVGFLYAAYIAVPALHDAPAASLEVTNLAIQMLAEVYYTDVENVEIASPLVSIVFSFIIAATFLILMYWPYSSTVSRKSLLRSWLGVGLFFLFLVVLADRLLYSFLPLSLIKGDTLGNIVETTAMVTAMFAVMFGPFVSSVYLCDPVTIAKRNLAIITIIAAVIILDLFAFGIEFVLLEVGRQMAP